MAASDVIAFGDRYHRESRTVPSLLTAFPLLLTLFAVFPSMREFATAVAALIGYCGVVAWLSHIARARGDALERNMFGTREPWPTTVLLRHAVEIVPSNDEIQSFRSQTADRDRLKDYLRALNPDIKMPMPETETGVQAGKEAKNAPDAVAEANSQYAHAVRWLREATRSTEDYRLVYEENITYGFKRNLLALRPIATWMALLSLALIIVILLCGVPNSAAGNTTWLEHFWPYLLGRTDLLATALLLALYLFAFWVLVSRAQVRIAGYAYARQLIFSIETLHDAHRKLKAAGTQSVGAPAQLAPVAAGAPSAAAGQKGEVK